MWIVVYLLILSNFGFIMQPHFLVITIYTIRTELRFIAELMLHSKIAKRNLTGHETQAVGRSYFKTATINIFILTGQITIM